MLHCITGSRMPCDSKFMRSSSLYRVFVKRPCACQAAEKMRFGKFGGETRTRLLTAGLKLRLTAADPADVSILGNFCIDISSVRALCQFRPARETNEFPSKPGVIRTHPIAVRITVRDEKRFPSSRQSLASRRFRARDRPPRAGTAGRGLAVESGRRTLSDKRHGPASGAFEHHCPAVRGA